MQFISWGTTLFLALALSLWGGMKIDERAGFTTPLLVWILPLIVLIAMIYRLIRDTSKPKPPADDVRS